MSAKERILLVDDDSDFVASTTDLLEAHGYNVTSARDGASGFDLARKERPDLMVLDVMMATKTEGFEVARKIPACPELRNMPVLLVTGIRSEMKLGFRLEPDTTWLPVNRIMEKPIDPAVFVAAVGELLRSRSKMDWKHGARRPVKGILAEKEAHLWTIAPQATVLEAAQMMEKYRIGALPVVKDGKVVGLIAAQDCVRGVLLQDRSARGTQVREVMSSPVDCISLDDTTEECVSLMTHRRVRHLPVIDDGKLVGIISIGDVVRAAVAEKNFLIEQLERYIAQG
jgi:CBS domain-containing protein